MKHLDKSFIIINKEDPGYRIEDIRRTKSWLFAISKEEGCGISFLNYIFVADSTLIKLNVETFNHDYYTDVITFDLSDEANKIEGDIYISYDRVAENARTFHVKRMNEIRRVMAHGLLHLLGYKDKTKVDQKKMREKENYYLSKFELI